MENILLLIFILPFAMIGLSIISLLFEIFHKYL